MDRKLLQYLVEYLVKESEAHGCALPPAAADAAHDDLASASADELWLAFRSLVNVRPPWPAPAEFLAAQNELLQGLIAEAGVATLADATPSPQPSGKPATDPDAATHDAGKGTVAGQASSTTNARPTSLARTGSSVTVFVVLTVGLMLVGVSLNVWRMRR